MNMTIKGLLTSGKNTEHMIVSLIGSLIMFLSQSNHIP